MSWPLWLFDSPLLRRALAQLNVPAVRAIVRAACGLSQRDLAGIVGWSPAALSYYERGRRDAVFDIRAVLQFADALGMPRAALLPLILADPDAGLAPGAGSGTGMDVDRRGFGGLAAGAAAAVILPAAGAPPGVSSSHLRYWQACANALYIRDRVVGGTALLQPALRQWQRVRQAVKVPGNASQTGCELRATAGDLALCIGWIALDGGNLPLARSLYGEARQLAAGAGDTLLTARFLPRLVPEQKFEFIKASTGRKNTRRFPDPTNRSHLIAALAYEFVKTGPVLMFCAQTNFVESCAKALADRIELAQLTDETAPDCFTRSRYPSADVAAAWLGADDPITKMLRVGVAVHHGRLPDAVRRAVEDDYRSGRIKVLATTTLGQGVNLPVRTVLVHSVRRRDEDNNETRFSARDYWNIAGRAGRAGFETDGLTVHLVLNNRDYEDLRFFLDQADSVEPVTSSLFAVLNNLAAQRISSEDALAELDPGLMALLVEEGADNIESLIAQVKPLLEGSLVGVQAATRNRSLNPLIDLATRGARDIADSIPFARLEAFAKTGLTSARCQRLVSHIDANRDRLLPLLTDSTRLPELISIMLNGISGLNEMQPRRAYDGDYEQLTLEWISGQSVPVIAANMTLPGNEAEVGATARAIEEVTSYLFPWGFSAYLQLAAHLLDTDPSIEVAAAPGLVRYGVPDPVAAWLLGFGLIDRHTAIAVAARYHRDSGENSPAQLRNWLAAQDPVLLAAAFPSEPDSTVRELSKAIRRISRPRLARDLGSGNLLPRSATVYLGRDAPEFLAASRLTEGDTLSLLRDYDDVIDRNQIQVTFRSEPIGRLDAFSAALLAVEIDAGTSVIATVTGVPADYDVGVLSVDLREETNRSPA